MTNNMEKFFKDFEYQIFPIIKGEDGQGIARFKAVVEKKRIDVEKRKIEKMKNRVLHEVYSQIINSQSHYTKNIQTNNAWEEIFITSIKMNQGIEMDNHYHCNYNQSIFKYDKDNKMEIIEPSSHDIVLSKSRTSIEKKDHAA